MVGKVQLKQPILIIVRNIKGIKPQVLNELIHLVSNARADRGYNFNLILGVQSNCREELHLRVHIQNCVKLTIKTFFFPSMKNIIFECISNLLMSNNNILTFDGAVIRQLIQSINLYGMSLDRFKLILRTLLNENIRANQETFYIHFMPLTLCSKKEWEKKYAKKLGLLIDKSFQVYRTFALRAKDVKGDQAEIAKRQDTLDKEARESKELLLTSTFEYIVNRRH